MSRCVILGLVALLTLPSFAAKRMTVAQLEKTLTSAAAEHKTDIEIANLTHRALRIDLGSHAGRVEPHCERPAHGSFLAATRRCVIVSTSPG